MPLKVAMHIYSYKYFLHLKKNLPQTSPLIKLLLTTAALVLILSGAFSAFYWYHYQKDTPARAARQYLEAVIISFNSTKTATDELIKNFMVAGAKIQYVETKQEEPQARSAYYSSLDDIERIIQQINLISKNLDSAKSIPELSTAPSQFQDLNLSLGNYYQELGAFLKNLTLDYRFMRDITLAIGPNLYLPVLSQKDLWEKEDSELIKAHYENLQESSNTALSSLAKLDTPEKFRPYWEQEIAYITLLVNLSSGITNTLSVTGDTSGDVATQLEKAYELLVKSERENGKLAEDIFKNRAAIFETKRILEDLVSIRLTQNSLVARLEEAISQASSQF